MQPQYISHFVAPVLTRACPNTATPCFRTFGLSLETWFLPFQENVVCSFVQAAQERSIGVSKCECQKLKDPDVVPAPEMSQFGQLMETAWASITSDELRSAMRKAIFPTRVKLPSSSR